MGHNGSMNKLLIELPRWQMVESNCCRVITIELLLVGILPLMLFLLTNDTTCDSLAGRLAAVLSAMLCDGNG